MARALMSRPRLIVMDEPTMGLSPLFVDRVLELIQTINGEGVSVFMVEQNASLALKLVDFVHVMSKGQVVYSAKPEELWANEQIKHSYLGI